MSPKIVYRSINMGPDRVDRIHQANAIIEEYQAQGFVLTLRQLYYQFVARAFIENNLREYKNLVKLISDGRLSGRVDWNAIEDRTRHLEELAQWRDPAHALESIAEQFRTDRWAKQDVRFEVWIEKEALAGVFEPICQELHVPFFCCRGYTSQSEMWRAAMRLRNYNERAKQSVRILHFGDHDPSGMDMTDDIIGRLSGFGLDLNLDRLALNMDQVDEYGPPPNPAKLSDSRAPTYISMYGDESWELDALEPAVLAALVEDAVLQYRDEELWDEAAENDHDNRECFATIGEHWDAVRDYTEGFDDE